MSQKNRGNRGIFFVGKTTWSRRASFLNVRGSTENLVLVSSTSAEVGRPGDALPYDAYRIFLIRLATKKPNGKSFRLALGGVQRPLGRPTLVLVSLDLTVALSVRRIGNARPPDASRI